MDVEDLKYQINNLIDRWAGEENTTEEVVITESSTEEKVRILPEGKRVVRTKSSGDRVYLIDEEKKTRQWVTNPEILEGLGFKIEDVTETDDTDLLGYQMGPALYRIDG